MMKSLNKRYRNIPQHKVTCDRPISSVQWLSRVRLFATPWITARQASLSITNSRSSLRLTSIESVIPSSHLILCCPLLLLPSIPPSIRVFSNESALRMKWPKYWSFSFSISPSQEIPELISFSQYYPINFVFSMYVLKTCYLQIIVWQLGKGRKIKEILRYKTR